MNPLAEIPTGEVLEGCRPDQIPPEVFDSAVPILLKDLVSGWPAVQSCRDSLTDAARYLSNFWITTPVTAYVGEADIHGRFFYDEDFTGFNFKSGAAALGQVFQRIAEQQGSENAQAIYVGSTPVDRWLPGFRAQNDVALTNPDALVSFWLGTRTRISAHYDFPDNLACVVAGKRRFTLFPPEQVENLYVGPIDKTPSGQAISLVDFTHPDENRFPKFWEACKHALCFDLEPGDALYIPSMWWHHVESMSDFNMLVNYWWCDSPMAMGSPTTALMHALLSIRDLPPRQRNAWKALFDHYVFKADKDVYEHIPEAGRGCLAPMDDTAARRLRAELLNRLNQ